MVLTVPGGGDEGGGDRADSDVDPSEAEHGRAIYCDADDSGPIQGGSETTGGTGPKEMVGADRDRLEGGQGPDVSRQCKNSVTLSGPPLRGGDVGPHKEDGVSPGRLPGQGCKAFNRETASPGEGWMVVIPVPGGGDEGGGDRADSNVDPSEAEHGRAIYCDAADSGPM